MTHREADQTAEALAARGFDVSEPYDRDEGDTDLDDADHTWAVSVRCSQCEALVICGLATHETGCLNSRRSDNDDVDDNE